MDKIVFCKTGHRFFDDLVVFLFNYDSIMLAREATMTGIAKSCYADQGINIQGSIMGVNKCLRFYPKVLMDTLFKESWPETVGIEIISNEMQKNEIPLNLKWLKGFDGILGFSIQSTFVHYFESSRSIIESTYGKNTSQWPDILNFGRVIRNAFSHGGEIRFDNLSALGVNWKNLTYTPRDNGKNILFIDITPVEIIFLMKEIDELI